MKKYQKILACSMLAFSLFALGACGDTTTGGGTTDSTGDATNPPADTTSEETQVIQVVGSTSVEPLITGLADQFSNENGNIQVQIQAPGSSGGITAVSYTHLYSKRTAAIRAFFKRR